MPQPASSNRSLENPKKECGMCCHTHPQLRHYKKLKQLKADESATKMLDLFTQQQQEEFLVNTPLNNSLFNHMEKSKEEADEAKEEHSDSSATSNLRKRCWNEIAYAVSQEESPSRVRMIRSGVPCADTNVLGEESTSKLYKAEHELELYETRDRNAEETCYHEQAQTHKEQRYHGDEDESRQGMILSLSHSSEKEGVHTRLSSSMTTIQDEQNISEDPISWEPLPVDASEETEQDTDSNYQSMYEEESRQQQQQQQEQYLDSAYRLFQQQTSLEYFQSYKTYSESSPYTQGIQQPQSYPMFQSPPALGAEQIQTPRSLHSSYSDPPAICRTASIFRDTTVTEGIHYSDQSRTAYQSEIHSQRTWPPASSRNPYYYSSPQHLGQLNSSKTTSRQETVSYFSSSAAYSSRSCHEPNRERQTYTPTSTEVAMYAQGSLQGREPSIYEERNIQTPQVEITRKDVVGSIRSSEMHPGGESGKLPARSSIEQDQYEGTGIHSQRPRSVAPIWAERGSSNEVIVPPPETIVSSISGSPKRYKLVYATVRLPASLVSSATTTIDIRPHLFASSESRRHRRNDNHQETSPLSNSTRTSSRDENEEGDSKPSAKSSADSIANRMLNIHGIAPPKDP